MYRVRNCNWSHQRYFKGTEGAEVNCGQQGQVAVKMPVYQPLCPPHTLHLCPALVSILHDMLWLSRRGRVAFQVSRWKQAMHHLVLGEKVEERGERESTASQHSLLGSDPPQPSISTIPPALFYLFISFLCHHIMISHAAPCPTEAGGGPVSRRGKQRMGGWREGRREGT